MSRTSKRRTSAGARPKAPERQRILDAAESIFAERGYSDTRMQDIAASAKTSLRDVYAVAKGKAQIFRTLHELRASDLLSQIEGTLADETRRPSDSLMEVIAVVVTFLLDHADFLRIQLREGRAWAIDESDHMLAGARHASDRLLEGLFRRGIRSAEFHDEDPKMMVASLRALEQVQLAAWVARRDRIAKRAVTEAIQRQATRLFCR